MIIIFVGPSGSGKDYFFTKTIEKFDLNKIITCTTRPKRDNEEEGKEYYFIDNKMMDDLEKNNKLIERRNYNTIHGMWSYATRGDIIDFDKNYIIINTWEAYEKYIKYFNKELIIPFYFELELNTRFERAFKREQLNKEKRYLEMCRRFLADEKDFGKDKIEKYNPIMIDNNGTVEQTEEQIDNNIKRLLRI